ncbi:hypothetical protein C7S20_19325 [Christiangramia fulva]|uniref:Uncharacterized protein n=1 Tax=Christiangramia fulva TaxID=2126553 RepID=A0A2R3ZAG3_9FLAO|nr:hypothetical protein [Christiangramia fulva]AVR47230.1 hypothetical protein C7S20_19325 [Christiangramia fulva]
MNFYKNNEMVPMTRRYPDLKDKVKKRDNKISIQLIRAWDVERDAEKVLKIFLQNIDKLSSYRYWELLRSVWIICGTVENAQFFSSLMKSNKPNRHYFSTPEEHEFLRSLPDQMDVYRACNSPQDGGISWTLDYDYACKYAKDFQKNMVLNNKINKSEVFAYINRNNESEILIL